MEFWNCTIHCPDGGKAPNIDSNCQYFDMITPHAVVSQLLRLRWVGRVYKWERMPFHNMTRIWKIWRHNKDTRIGQLLLSATTALKEENASPYQQARKCIWHHLKRFHLLQQQDMTRLKIRSQICLPELTKKKKEVCLWICSPGSSRAFKNSMSQQVSYTQSPEHSEREGVGCWERSRWCQCKCSWGFWTLRFLWALWPDKRCPFLLCWRRAALLCLGTRQRCHLRQVCLKLMLAFLKVFPFPATALRSVITVRLRRGSTVEVLPRLEE